MNFKHIILLAATCIVAIWSDCVPDPIPDENNNSHMVGNFRPINVSDENVRNLIPNINLFKYNNASLNDNLLIVTCKITNLSLSLFKIIKIVIKKVLKMQVLR